MLVPYNTLDKQCVINNNLLDSECYSLPITTRTITMKIKADTLTGVKANGDVQRFYNWINDKLTITLTINSLNYFFIGFTYKDKDYVVVVMNVNGRVKAEMRTCDGNCMLLHKTIVKEIRDSLYK